MSEIFAMPGAVITCPRKHLIGTVVAPLRDEAPFLAEYVDWTGLDRPMKNGEIFPPCPKCGAEFVLSVLVGGRMSGHRFRQRKMGAPHQRKGTDAIYRRGARRTARRAAAMSDDQRLLRAKEVAAMLSISPRMLQEHVNDGTLPRIIIGRGKTRKHYAFDPADIEDFKRRRKEFGGGPCPSISRKSRKSSITTSGPEAFDFAALREKRRAEKRKQ